jgi:cellulose synthase operon protein C
MTVPPGRRPRRRWADEPLPIFAYWRWPWLLVACQSINDGDTIAKLRHARIEVQEERLVGGLDKAMAKLSTLSEETPESALTPEAIRRLADLKLEKEYGTLTDRTEPPGPANPLAPSRPQGAGGKHRCPFRIAQAASPISEQSTKAPARTETRVPGGFRGSRAKFFPTLPAATHAGGRGDDLERANAREAIALVH